jgi:DNA anti-recombination protein RmuC
MIPSLTEQMQGFASSLQKAMADHMQSTMKLQMDMLKAIQSPVADRMQSITSGVQNIFLEQMKTLSTGMTNPLSMQVQDFSTSVQRIMSEQMQIFAASTANPTPEQLEEFFATMRSIMAEQMQLAGDLQAALSKQMQQFMEQLQSTMTGLAGSSGEGASEEQ